MPGFSDIIRKVFVGMHRSIYRSTGGRLAGKFRGGAHRFGLANDGLGYAMDDNNKGLISMETIAAVEKARKEIIEGKLVVTDFTAFTSN